ncbi:MAG: biotin--[acetyl-CoA-carboxylase] ligase [Bacteroidota bacterium]
MRKIFKYDAVDSTNDLLLKWAENESISSGSIIWANNQYKGRGQFGRVWESKPGDNLTFSMLIRHDSLQVMEQFMLSKAISVAILKSLLIISPNFHIKWPNDIYLNGKKVAGILIENSIKGRYIGYSVVGVGVNVNQRKFSDHIVNASSIYNESGVELELHNLLNQIADHIEFFVNYVYRQRYEKITDVYLKYLYKLNEISVFEKDGKIFNGIIRGVDEFGRVNIELEDDEIVTFSNGEIKMKS